jgi:ribosome-associated protein
MTVLAITPSLSLDDRELDERFVRGSGPGGQNVNKVATAVELRFDVERSSLPGDVKARLRAIAGSRLTTDDVLVIAAREYRTQGQNRDAARARLVELIRRAAVRPKSRRATRPTKAAKERRLAHKRHRSETKRARRGDE